MRISACMLFSLLAFSLAAQPVADSRKLFTEMMDALSGIKTASFVLSLDERIVSDIRHSQFVVKLQNHPLKIYSYSIRPNPGAEALYIEGTNQGKVLVKPNRFPYINLNLGIQSMLLRKNHQYSILQMGFSYVEKLLKKYIVRDGESFYTNWSAKPDQYFQSTLYDILEMNNPGYEITTYRVGKSETASSIAEKLLINDYRIIELNPGVNNYDVLNTGKIIKVPNSFARKLIFYLDKKTHLPVIQEVYDERGFYSRVKFESLVLNPVIPAQEFTREYPKYGF